MVALGATKQLVPNWGALPKSGIMVAMLKIYI
jgi:hypothetical protein